MFYEIDGLPQLESYGAIPQQNYKGHSKEKYPQKTARLAAGMAEVIDELIEDHTPDKIIIEEISIGGKCGVKQIKGLAMLHGMVCYLLNNGARHIDFVEFMPCSGGGKGGILPGWRSLLKLKKNGDWKASAVKRANDDFKLKLKYDDNDVADAILIGQAYLQHVDAENEKLEASKVEVLDKGKV